LLNFSFLLLTFSPMSWIAFLTLYICLFEVIDIFKGRLLNFYCLAFQPFQYLKFGYWGVMSFWKSPISLHFPISWVFALCFFHNGINSHFSLVFLHYGGLLSGQPSLGVIILTSMQRRENRW
jgi:hypothetical protein